MISRSSLATAVIVGALVFTGSTPASAANSDAVKRAIIVTVLNNLGVEPTARLIDELVGDIPMDVLNSSLVTRVGKLLDKSGDPTAAISAAVDSDGDGIPDETAGRTAAATDDESEEEEEEDDDSPANPGTGGNTTQPGSDDDEPEDEDDEPEDDDEDEESDEDEDEEDDHDGDN